MRQVLALCSVLALAACTPPREKACDDAIKATLKTPASYKRVSTGANEIVYDAVNEYNAPIRQRGLCFYDEKTGKADWLPFKG